MNRRSNKFIESTKRKISNFFYWLRTHTINKYHLIDCRSPSNGYNWGWIDRDHLIVFACFSILKDFVEKELPHDYTDWTAEGWCEAKREIDELYAWWTGGRAQKLLEIQAELKRFIDLGSENNDQRMKLVSAEEDMDNKMLLRLIKVRGYMWT